MMPPHWILLRVWNVSDNSCRKIKTCILCLVTFFWKSCHLCANAEKYGRARQDTGDSIMWHLLIACWMTEAINTLSEYVILVAFPWQQQIHKHTSVLYFMYTASLVSDVLPVCGSSSIVYTAASWRAGCQKNRFIWGKYEEIICSLMLAVHPTSLWFSG